MTLAGSGINTTYQTPCQVDEADQGTGDPECIVPKDQGSRRLPSSYRPMTIDARSIAKAHPGKCVVPKNHASQVRIVLYRNDGHDSFTTERNSRPGNIGDEVQHTRVYISY